MKDFYEAWNRGDVVEIAHLLERGTYVDPLCAEPLTSDALVAHLQNFLAAFKSVRIEVASTIEGADAIAVEWRLEGICDGAIDAELKAHGVSIDVRGIDMFAIDSAGLRHVRRTFDRRALADALGLQTIVEPIADGRMTFGYSVREWVSKEKPGALGMTWIMARDEAEKATIRAHARQIVHHFSEVPGFIGIVTGFTGLHGFTFTAWESEEALRIGTHTGAHREAMQAFQEGLSGGVFTSVWTPARLNRMWIRCINGHANDAMRADRKCEHCGAPLPEREPYL